MARYLGARNLQEKKWFRHFTSALSRSPTPIRLHFNDGIAYIRLPFALDHCNSWNSIDNTLRELSAIAEFKSSLFKAELYFVVQVNVVSIIHRF